LTTIDTDEFRTLLEQERERLTKAVKFLHDENPGSLTEELGDIVEAGIDYNHLGDTASATFDRELDEGVGERAQQIIEEIDAALRRLDDGTYGRCEVGGEPIPVERLRAIPWARRCVAHS
jgi:RNA polymerase-binding transcription factor DksA